MAQGVVGEFVNVKGLIIAGDGDKSAARGGGDCRGGKATGGVIRRLCPVYKDFDVRRCSNKDFISPVRGESAWLPANLSNAAPCEGLYSVFMSETCSLMKAVAPTHLGARVYGPQSVIPSNRIHARIIRARAESAHVIRMALAVNF